MSGLLCRCRVEREGVRGGLLHIYIYIYIYNECVTMGKRI